MRIFAYVCFEIASSDWQPLCCFAKTEIKSDFKWVVLQLQSNLGYPNADYPKLLGYSKMMDSPDFFLYYLLQ